MVVGLASGGALPGVESGLGRILGGFLHFCVPQCALLHMVSDSVWDGGYED